MNDPINPCRELRHFWNVLRKWCADFWIDFFHARFLLMTSGMHTVMPAILPHLSLSSTLGYKHSKLLAVAVITEGI